MTGKHGQTKDTLNWLSFCAGMAVGMILFSSFFLALVLLDKI